MCSKIILFRKIFKPSTEVVHEVLVRVTKKIPASISSQLLLNFPNQVKKNTDSFSHLCQRLTAFQSSALLRPSKDFHSRWNPLPGSSSHLQLSERALLLLFSPSLLFPERPFFFFFPGAFRTPSLYGWDLLVSCGRLVPSSSSGRKLRGRFFVPPGGLECKVVPVVLRLMPRLTPGSPTPAPLVGLPAAAPVVRTGRSRISAVWTPSRSPCSHMRRLQSCSVRPLSCIICAWLTERLLKKKKKVKMRSYTRTRKDM